MATDKFWGIGNAKGWDFLNGKWSDGPDNALTPPDGYGQSYVAIKEDAAYGDFSATFRFKFRCAGGSARFVFRAQDSDRFYALDIPINGQQSRSRHFWAGIVMADGTPLQKYLCFGLVPGLCCRIDSWYDVRIEAKGSRIKAWINDIKVADVEDDTYASGRIGFQCLTNPYQENAHFASVVVEGAPVDAAPWPGLQPLKPYWITPCPEPEPGTFQSYANIIQLKSGEVILYLTFGNPNACETRRAAFIRSKDGGRTWGKQEPATLQQGLGSAFVRNDGTLVCTFANHPIYKESPLYTYESEDEGRSWKGPIPLMVDGGWPAEWKAGGPWRTIRLSDGALLMPIMCNLADEAKSPSLVPYWAALTIRSDDDGKTWSAPIQADSNHMKPGTALVPTMGGGLVHAARYFEVGIAEGTDGSIIGIGRPERDPYMWQLRSPDGGRTWDPGALGHFPGYCPSITRTQSGALVATTRYPYFSAHLSRNNGRTWDPPVIIDYCMWANQQALEVEPNVVLVTYMGEITHTGKADSRIARIKVTDGGLVLDH